MKRQEVIAGRFESGHGCNASDALMRAVPVVVMNPGIELVSALEEIVSGKKRIEYREIKPYWTEKLATVTTPFFLRLINGMSAKAPEATVEIDRLVKNLDEECYEFHIAHVTEVKNMARTADHRGHLPASRRLKSPPTGAFFFLWNAKEDKYSFRNLNRIIKEANTGKPYIRRWRCLSTRPTPGDTAYLQRTGSNNNGVFARGTAGSIPYIDPYGDRRVQLQL